MNIAAFQPISLSDYPGHPASIIFTQGCNCFCSYCHNPRLIPGQGAVCIPAGEVLERLESRREKIKAVVVTGGEPTLQVGLPSFLEQIKGLGLKVKLDTNGSRPGVLGVLIRGGLVDYIAMDIKGPLSKYLQVTGGNHREMDPDDIRRSLRLIMSSFIEHEFRTTVVKSLLSVRDLVACGRLIRGARKYVLQPYNPAAGVQTPILPGDTYSGEEFSEICSMLSGYVQRCMVR